MLFNSLSYVVFLPIVFAIYWIIPNKFRWFFLLVASYYFYMSWNVKYVVLILFTTVVSYSSARIIEKCKKEKHRKIIVAIAAILCLLVLFFFKYFNFMTVTAVRVLSLLAINLSPITIEVLLPVGISFYTFQTIAYVFDVYRGKVHAEKNFGIYATFISFFPQLVAGPIERTSNLLPQIKAEHKFDENKAIEGAKLMIWGYYKKLLIADNISVYVDTVYGNLSEYTGIDLLLAIFLFSIQIYCDFSGYSDIAIGTAKLLDIELMENFRSPYFSASLKEFWNRWHISLSTWFKDYMYIPMGGNRCGKIRHYMNLLITFLVSGLWHGASWSFVLWGGIHGMAQVIEDIADKNIRKIRDKRIGHFLCSAAVFIFVSFAWVPFRAQGITNVLYIFRHVFDNVLNPGVFFSSGLITPSIIFSILFFISILVLHDYYSNNKEKAEAKGILPKTRIRTVCSWTLYILLGLIIAFGSRKGVAAEFVYFQF